MRIRTTLASAAAATALVVAGVTALPALATDDVRNAALTSPEESAAAETLAAEASNLPQDQLKLALDLAEALQRDLGISPEQFFAQATTAANLANLAAEWQQKFAEVFGGVWIDDQGNGVVGVADGGADAGTEADGGTGAGGAGDATPPTAGEHDSEAGADAGTEPAGEAADGADSAANSAVGTYEDVAGEAAELRQAAAAAGFVVQDVALSEAELSAREKQVQEIVDGLEPEIKEIVRDVRTDRTRGEVVVTTEGGTEAQVGTVTAAVHGLAKVETVNAPNPQHDTAPFGSLGPEGENQTGTNPDGTGTVLGVEPTTTEPIPGDETRPSPSDTPAPDPQMQVPSSPEGAAGSLAGILDPETLATLMQMLGLAAGSIDAAGVPTGSLGTLGRAPQADPEPRPADSPREATVEQPSGDQAVIGGTAYDAKLSHGVLECSTGFNGTLNGAPVVITAAHCNRADEVRAVLADGTEFGTFTDTKAEGIDSALIRIDDDHAARFQNNLVGGADDKQQPITGTAAPVVGQVACKMGSRTGFSCGKITETGATIDVAGQRTLNNSFLVDLCALPGDSGGVVFSGDKALGISSASNIAGEADCSSAGTNAAAAGVKPSLSVVPIEDILAAHPGLKLNTE